MNKDNNKTPRTIALELQRKRLLNWMDANDAQLSLPANEELRVIDEQLAQIHSV